MIERERLGKIVRYANRFAGDINYEGTWFAEKEKAGGGVIMDNCIHAVDLFRWLAGEVETVSAFMETAVQKMEVEDTAIISLRSQRGGLGVIESSWSTPFSPVTIEVYGSKGVAIVDYDKNELRYRLKGDSSWRIEKNRISYPEQAFGGEMEEEIKVGVVGFGWWWQVLTQYFREVPGVKVVAVCKIQEKGTRGIVVENVVHAIDGLIYLMGDVERVYAEGNRAVFKHPTLPDSTIFTLRFKNGAIAGIGGGCTSDRRISREYMDIHFENGLAQVSGKLDYPFDLRLLWRDEDEVEEHHFEGGDGVREEIRHFIECITEDKEPLCNGAEGRKSLEIALAILESIEKNKPIELGG